MRPKEGASCTAALLLLCAERSRLLTGLVPFRSAKCDGVGTERRAGQSPFGWAPWVKPCFLMFDCCKLGWSPSGQCDAISIPEKIEGPIVESHMGRRTILF